MKTPRKSGKAPAARGGALDRELKTRIDAELHERVRKAAVREERSEAAIVRRALRAYLPEVAT